MEILPVALLSNGFDQSVQVEPIEFSPLLQPWYRGEYIFKGISNSTCFCHSPEKRFTLGFVIFEITVGIVWRWNFPCRSLEPILGVKYFYRGSWRYR